MTYYVTMTDTFMSGWGAASNKINKYIVECDTIEQAEAIEKAAQDRPEMKRVNIRLNRPYYGKTHLMSFCHFSDLSGPWLAYYNHNEKETTQ